ncbi:SLATT domain-containing protein [Lentzea waywayandensis]|nr:DUF4231 domain-containing protein [Lentzea waywayandensis]
MESVSIGSTYSPKADEGDDRSAEYVADLQAEVSGLERASKRRLLAYRTLRFLVLTTSAITPALALLSAPSWITAAVASLAFLSEGTIQLTRMHDRAVLDIRRVSLLGRELRMFRTQVGNYTNTDRRLLLLVQRIEAIREENDRDVLNVLQQSFGAYGQERPSANESGRPEGRPPPVT